MALYQLFGFKSATNSAVAVGHVHNRERGLLFLVCWLPIIAQLADKIKLEVGGKAHCDAPGGADSVAREQTAEIDDVQNICEILAIDLEAHLDVI